MKVTAIRCPQCGDTVFSRAQHDFRTCSCGSVFMDGGLEYSRYGFLKEGFKNPEIVTVEINQTPQELYDDWNTRTDKYGIITGE